MKKLLVTLLMLCLLTACACAQTEDGFAYSVLDGSAIITSYTGSAAALTLPDTLGGYPVTAIRYCAFRDCISLTQVTIPEGIVSIGSNAFERCTSLAQLNLPQSLETIGTHAFYACAALDFIDVPGEIARVHPYAFYGCSAVKRCRMDSRAALVLTDYGYSFTDPAYPQLDLKAFMDGDGARTLTVAHCDPSAVSVALPEGVTVIARGAFAGCTALRRLTLPAGLTTIEDGAFTGCKNVTVVSPAGAGQALAQDMAESGFTWQLSKD